MRAIERSIVQYENKKIPFEVLAVVVVTLVLTIGMKLLWPLSTILAIQIVLFFHLFNRPVWAMAALIFGQLTASGYVISLSGGAELSIRFLWTVLAIILVVPLLKSRQGINVGRRANRIIIPAIIFFILATISNLINTDMTQSLVYLRQTFTALTILILLPAVVDDRKDIKILAIVAIVTSVASAIVAVMQHYSYMGLPILTLYPDLYHNGRTPGLADSEVRFSIYLPIVILPMLGILLLKGVNSRTRDLLLILAVIMCVALYFTYTRSGIYALGIGLIALTFLLKGRLKPQLLLVVLIIGAGFFLYTSGESNRYSQWFSDDESAAGRLVLWQAGVNVALDNPIFGIGYDQFIETSTEYESEINPVYLETQGAGGTLGFYEPHNDFIRVWLSFGTFALIAFVFLIIGAFRNFLESYNRSKDLFIKGLSVGCIGALVAYIVSSCIHNVMDSLFILWILAGLSIAIAKVTLPPQESVRQ